MSEESAMSSEATTPSEDVELLKDVLETKADEDEPEVIDLDLDAVPPVPSRSTEKGFARKQCGETPTQQESSRGSPSPPPARKQTAKKSCADRPIRTEPVEVEAVEID